MKTGVNHMKVIAYLRVSSLEQDPESQKFTVLKYAHEHDLKIDEFFEISISTKKSLEARRINELIDQLCEGDVLLISELSRIGRSISQIIQIIDSLIKKNVKLIIIKQGTIIDGNQDIQSKIMTTMFALFAEIERDLISERTKMGLAAARAKGRILGRPKGKGKSKLDQYKLEIEALLNNGSSKTFIAKRYSTSLPNFYAWLKNNNINY